MAGFVIQATGVGQSEFQSAWVRMAAWCQAGCPVRFLAAAVLGLTQPREVGTFVLFLEVRQIS